MTKQLRGAPSLSPKRLARSILGKLGYRVQRIPKALIRRRESAYVVQLEDILYRKIASVDSFFFVQIGANDGETVDPIHGAISYFGCRGILVEPQSKLVGRLKESYGDNDNVIVENVAISASDQLRQLHHVKPEFEHLYQWSTGIASFDREHVRKHFGKNLPRSQRADIDSYLTSTAVECLTYGSLLEKHRVKHVNLLQIDTEGFDFEIIKSVIALGKLPDIISYEHRHLSPSDREACWSQLVDCGYALLVVAPDTIAIYRSDED